MAKRDMVIDHSLSRQEALRRTKNLLEELKKKYADKISNLQEEWDGNIGKFSFSAIGFPVSGTLTVESSQIKLRGKLPFAAVFFWGKVEKTIRQEAKRLFA